MEGRLYLTSYVTANYFPLTPGLTWTYTGSYSDELSGTGGSATDTKTTASDSVDGTPVTRFDDSINVTGGSATESRYYGMSASGLEFYGQSNGQATVTLDEPVLILHTVANDGDVISWSNVGITASGSSNGTSFTGTGTDSGTSTVVGTESITLANGQTVSAMEFVVNHTESYSLDVDGVIATEVANIVETVYLVDNFGIAQFSGNVSLTANAEGQQVTDTITESFESDTSPAQLVFAEPIPDVTAGVTMNLVTVDIEDSNGVINTSDNSDVTLSITDGEGPAGATLSGPLTVQAVNGVATFTGLSIDLAGGYTLTASDAEDAASSDSDNFEVTPSVLMLAELDKNIYSGGTGIPGLNSIPGGYQVYLGSSLAAGAYTTNDDAQVVIAFRGTDLQAPLSIAASLTDIQDILADLSFPGTTPNAFLTAQIDDAVSFVDSIYSNPEFSGADITLTGHSLGGAIAQLLGNESGLATIAFNAPGASQLFDALSPDMAPIANIGDSSTNINYRLYGDPVSRFGTQFPGTVTLNDPSGTSIVVLSNPWLNAIANLQTFFTIHLMPAVISVLEEDAPFVVPVSSDANDPNDTQAFENIVQPNSSVDSSAGQTSSQYSFNVTSEMEQGALIDPSSGTDFTMVEYPGSPNFSSITLPSEEGVTDYDLRYYSDGTWSPYQVIQPLSTDSFGPGVEAVEFDPLDSNANDVTTSGPLLFDATFATTGTFNGTLVETGPATDSTPDQLAFTQQPTTAFVGSVMSQPFAVTIEDSSGNVVTSDNSTVTLAILNGPPGAVLGGTVSVAAVDGVATFSNLVLPDAGSYTLEATDGALATANSNSVNVIAGWVDTADMNIVSGWAINSTDTSSSVTVEIVITGGPTQLIAADETRSDLQSVVGSSDHGFTYATPVLSQGNHTAYIYAVEAGGNVLLATKTLVSQNSLFDEHYYLQANPDVAAAVNAGIIATGYDHYIEYGQYEGRSPSPYWNEAYYLAQNPDVAAAVKSGAVSSGFMQFYLYGQWENRPGLVYFDTDYYLENNPDVAAAVAAGVISPLEHFVLYGQYEGRDPLPYFSSAFYEAENPAIGSDSTGEPYSSPFEEFVEAGQYQGLIASDFYNEQIYLADNPDVAAAVQAGIFSDGFIHWLEYGQYEGRTAV